MNADDDRDRTQSLGRNGARPADRPLDTNRRADVCVIGAGIAGLTTAYLLGREGRKVLVLDDGGLAGGPTQRATAHLRSVPDDGFAAIERAHGKPGARLVAESRTCAIQRIESILREEAIDADFERLDGYLVLASGASPQRLQRELEASRRAGLEVDPVPRAPLSDWDTGPALRFRGQAQFHPLKYAAGLTRAIERDGGEIRTATRVTGVTGGPLVRVKTEQGPAVVAEAVVIATHAPFNDRAGLRSRQAGSMTYAIAATVPPGSVAKALYWDTGDPLHHVRLQGVTTTDGDGRPGHRDLLIVGGEDHRAGPDHGRPRFDRLEAWARERFPVREVPYRWSEQVRASNDGLAFIGRNPLVHPSVYVATGDAGAGLTHGTIAGLLLTDLIQGRRNRWAALYAPSRKKAGTVGGFLQENLNVARQYFDSLRGGPGASRSLVCPHLGCRVHWNDAEHTWDCPGHGSRFDQRGRVICGPATPAP